VTKESCRCLCAFFVRRARTGRRWGQPLPTPSLLASTLRPRRAYSADTSHSPLPHGWCVQTRRCRVPPAGAALWMLRRPGLLRRVARRAAPAHLAQSSPLPLSGGCVSGSKRCQVAPPAGAARVQAAAQTSGRHWLPGRIRHRTADATLRLLYAPTPHFGAISTSPFDWCVRLKRCQVPLSRCCSGQSTRERPRTAPRAMGAYGACVTQPSLLPPSAPAPTPRLARPSHRPPFGWLALASSARCPPASAARITWKLRRPQATPLAARAYGTYVKRHLSIAGLLK
jgi:hypothetical protein